ncbi:hypothetical protein FIBSPDRAFT_858591 [Athelia psychrophila]|uniref:DUF6534 domain-containing protein n=1 Tax=Athelia psychrophila TaxID=1759441 RepID=A0A166LU69_9AGAM|nr:hypothetical protein FIBSPDRAFT_858591 [Fibularhizoctonia sp. CBS 109695]
MSTSTNPGLTTFSADINGVIISMAMYGITCCQTLQYFYWFPHDSLRMKAMVAGAWVTETTNAVMLMYTIWLDLIVYRGVQGQHVQWTIIARTVTAEMAAVGVDCFFIGRINILDARRYRSLILLVPLVISSAAGITYTFLNYTNQIVTSTKAMEWCLALFAATRAVSDIGIGIAMCAVLYFQYRHYAMKKSKLIVSIVVRHALATGIVTSALSVIYVALNFAYPATKLWGAVHFIQEKVYVISLLAALNARRRFRAIAEADVTLATIPITIFPDEPYDPSSQLQPTHIRPRPNDSIQPP